MTTDWRFYVCLRHTAERFFYSFDGPWPVLVRQQTLGSAFHSRNLKIIIATQTGTIDWRQIISTSDCCYSDRGLSGVRSYQRKLSLLWKDEWWRCTKGGVYGIITKFNYKLVKIERLESPIQQMDIGLVGFLWLKSFLIHTDSVCAFKTELKAKWLFREIIWILGKFKARAAIIGSWK